MTNERNEMLFLEYREFGGYSLRGKVEDWYPKVDICEVNSGPSVDLHYAGLSSKQL